MAWPNDENLSPGEYQRLMALMAQQTGGIPGIVPGGVSGQPVDPAMLSMGQAAQQAMAQPTTQDMVPPATAPAQVPGLVPGVRGGAQAASQAVQDAQAAGVFPEQNKWLMPSLALMQFGATMMAPKEQRPAMMAQLPVTMLAAMKMQKDNELAKLYTKAYLEKDKAGKNLTTDQLLADALQRGDKAAVDKITSAIQDKKSAAERNMNEVEFFKNDPEGFARYQSMKEKVPKDRIGLTIDKDGNPVYANLEPGMPGPKQPQFFDPAMVDREAAKYNQTGELPGGFGMADFRKVVMTRASELANEAGTSPNEQIQNKAVYGATKTALGGLVKQQTMINAFTDNFDRNAALVRTIGQDVDRTGVPVINRWFQAGKRSLTGDPALAKFDVGVKTLVNEFTRITTTASAGNTQMAEQEIAKVEKLLSTAQTPEQFEAALSFMESETQNRKGSLATAVDIKRQELSDLALPGSKRKGPAATQQLPSGGGRNLGSMSTDELKALRDRLKGGR
jgi:hypothetical protein